jgi:hypothetical protein
MTTFEPKMGDAHDTKPLSCKGFTIGNFGSKVTNEHHVNLNPGLLTR